MKRHTVVAAVVMLAIISGACSDADEPTPATSAAPGVGSAEDVVFGSGVLPETIPDSFPMPAGSSIGSTMVVTDTGFTEVVIRISAERGISAQFFEQNLTQAGFDVESSADDIGDWNIEFNLDGAKGTIEISEPLEAVSQAVVRYNIP